MRRRSHRCLAQSIPSLILNVFRRRLIFFALQPKSKPIKLTLEVDQLVNRLNESVSFLGKHIHFNGLSFFMHGTPQGKRVEIFSIADLNQGGSIDVPSSTGHGYLFPSTVRVIARIRQTKL